MRARTTSSTPSAGISSSQSARVATDPPRNFLIYCDESGVHGSKHYGFGSLWLPWERRGDFAALIRELRERHGYHHEIKWQKVKRQTVPFYVDLVDAFFQKRWLMWHGLVVRAADVDRSLHRYSMDLARRKHFTMLLTSKISRFARPGKLYRVRVDPIHSSYSKADEACEVIANNTLERDLGGRYVHSVREVDSKRTPGIQLCDLFTGAVVGEWEGTASSDAKAEVRRAIAKCLGWEDLRADTYRDEWKFNIWFFKPTSQSRCVKTRAVAFRYRMPSYANRRT